MKKNERLDIVFEDKNIIIINKPAGLLTISTEKEKENTLYHKVYTYLKKKNQKVFIIHRLDRETSGLVLFAKTEKAKKILQDNWPNVIRRYYAIVYGNNISESGTIKVKLSETKTLYTYVSKEGKEAITKYSKLKENGKNVLLDVEILTGRKNQIRVSLSHIGCPIMGDKKYGKAPNPLRRLCLHAYYLEFEHPVTHQTLKFELDIPKAFNNLFK